MSGYGRPGYRSVIVHMYLIPGMVDNAILVGLLSEKFGTVSKDSYAQILQKSCVGVTVYFKQ